MCPTCGLTPKPGKADQHRIDCLSWRQAIEAGWPHKFINAKWDAACATATV